MRQPNTHQIHRAHCAAALMGCAVGTLATESRVVIQASDSGGCEMPTHLLIPGGRRCVPEQLRPNFTFVEWLNIVSQLERTVCRGGGCFGPDPLLGPGQALAASLNDSYSSTRGVSFSFTSEAWHPDRTGQQFHREFIIDVIGERCILTQESVVEVAMPPGTKPGRSFEATVLDGQVISVVCPKKGAPGAVAPGQRLPVALKSPVLVPQVLTMNVPEATAPGQVIQVAMPGGGMVAVTLPTDAVPGQSAQFTVECVQLMPMSEQELAVTVPPDAKPGQTIRVAVPSGNPAPCSRPEP